MLFNTFSAKGLWSGDNTLQMSSSFLLLQIVIPFGLTLNIRVSESVGSVQTKVCCPVKGSLPLKANILLTLMES